ncbi:helix-turn-helix transcriptional regulator [Pedobacter sp. MC2016-05]|uniref:helix-turn-helix domain-containing protein n=1 Tax=Pedobacter sp. MC2016-05 TaxID=2994474 RepID=UPI0022474BCB|nr:helix-turn-helix transcriptional regulator [Pedobacter sp. MC2016-05]MCX2474067.1 helix-turn-helix transcriptional regulator [Pedobacter sp. MC2016-05]
MNPQDEITIKKFGVNVKLYRKQKGLTILQLAEICLVDYTTISRIERALVNTTVTMVARIANALEVEETKLFN